MENLLAVCVAIIALELGILIAALLLALQQLQRTAQAVEVLTYRIDQQVEVVGDTLRSGWAKTLGAVIAGLMGGRRRG